MTSVIIINRWAGIIDKEDNITDYNILGEVSRTIVYSLYLSKICKHKSVLTSEYLRLGHSLTLASQIL